MIRASFLIILLSSMSAHSIEIKLNYTSIANLVYQLDCVSENTYACSDKNYNELWKKTFIKNDEDKKIISTWATIMAKYKVNATLAAQKTKAKDQESIDLSHKVRIASFEAKDMHEYFSHIDVVMQTTDRLEIEKIIKYFNPRFESWWKNNASKKGAKFISKTRSLLKQGEIKKKINQFANFYEAELPKDFRITLNLFFRPELISEPTSAQQMDNYAVSEFLTNQDPKTIMDVILRELCHFLFVSVDMKKFATLKQNFNSLKTQKATGAHNILNETLAATFGNGMMNEMLMPAEKWDKYLGHPNSFYNNHYIDAGAKATLPWLENWIESNRTLYDPEFVKTYYKNLDKTFGKKLEAPKVLLSYMLFIYDDKFNYTFEKDLHQHLFLTYTTWGDWKDKEVIRKVKTELNTNALIAVHPSHLNKLSENRIASKNDIQLIKTRLKKKSAVLYSLQRSPSAMTYVIATDKVEKVVKLIEALGQQESGFLGFFEKKP